MAHFDWDSTYSDDIYTTKNVNRDDLTDITYQIKRDLQCRRIEVYVNEKLQIILTSKLEKVENILTMMEIFEEINRIEKIFLSDFEVSNFEMFMEGEKTTIYSSYEKI